MGTFAAVGMGQSDYQHWDLLVAWPGNGLKNGVHSVMLWAELKVAA